MPETRKERQRRMSRERVRKHRARKKAEKDAALKTAEMELAGLNQPPIQLTDAQIEEGIEWMSSLKVPDGDRYGQAFDLEPWQREWVRGAMAPGIQVSGLSIARKNAKSMLNVLMCACFLAGPWNRFGWVGLTCADVGRHAAIMFGYLEAVAMLNGLDIVFRKSPQPGKAFGANRSSLTFLSADKHRSGHAENADAVWLDEAGALTENQRPLWNALYSSLGAKNGRMFCLGNQREGPMFLELEKRAGIDDMTHWTRYSAPIDCDPMDESVWHLANPGLGSIKQWQYMRGKAKDAEVSPGNLNYFMSYDLNMDVDPVRETICTVRQWAECVEREVALQDEPVVLGIDMGGSVSMSAAFAIGLETGRARMWCAFSNIPDILHRGREDGVDTTYILMRERGELRLYPGELVDPAAFMADVVGELAAAGCEIRAIGADRYRRGEFSMALRRAGIRTEVAWRGQGQGSKADGSADIRSFQHLVFGRVLRAPESLGMVNAIMNSHIDEDTGLNPVLVKNKSRGRIDLLTAGVMAAGLYERARRRESRGGFKLLRKERVL